MSGIAVLVLSLAALVLFGMSYTTGYYIFGQMQSGIIAVLLAAALAIGVAAPVLRVRFSDALWPRFLTFCVTGLLAAAAALLMGDRVEGIGNCVITDYDAGHGGEEAIYLSVGSAVLMLAAVVYNIAGSFFKDKAADAPVSVKERIGCAGGFGVTCVLVLLAVLIPVGRLAGQGGSSGAAAAAGQALSTYRISFNQANGNTDTMPDYQFLCGNVGSLARFENRIYVDIDLTLDGDGKYSIFAESYILEGGKKTEVGDATGIGMVMTTAAEGTYVENGDGTITTSKAAHVVYELQTDTYSAQMKDTVQISIDGKNDDGVYDSAEYASVLEIVPETVWTLEEGTIVSYHRAGEEPAAQEPETVMSEPAASSGNAPEGLEIASDDGGTTMTFYADGTYRFSFEMAGVEDEGTYTYDGTTLTVTNANGTEATAEGDPLKLHYTASQSEQLTGDFTIPAAQLP